LRETIGERAKPVYLWQNIKNVKTQSVKHFTPNVYPLVSLIEAVGRDLSSSLTKGFVLHLSPNRHLMTFAPQIAHPWVPK